MASSPRNRAAVKPAAIQTQNVAPAEPQVTLDDIISATKANSFVYTSVDFHTALIEQGLVMINPDMTDEHGRIATRATDAAMKENMTETATVTESVKPKFEVESDIPIPARVRKSSGPRAGRAPVYPFETMELGHSFFVPNKEGTNKKGEPYAPAAKAMASTVAGANAKFAQVVEGQTRVNRKGATVPVTVQTRLFKVYDTLKDHTKPESVDNPKGARVFRVDPA